MRDRPSLSDEAIVSCLRTSYAIDAQRVVFLPLGNDAAAWTYQVSTADGTSYFLKVRAGRVNEPGLMVPRHLSDHGVAQVIAPLATTTGAVWAELGRFRLVLYPFIEGRRGMERGMAEHQWVAYGEALRRIHATALPPDLAQRMRRETYVPAWAGMVRRLEEHLARHDFADPIERELAAFWRIHQDEIRTLLGQAEELGRRLQRATLPFVLCHADIHIANVLIDTADKLWIVDWDETTLAPKERDLMFVVGGGIIGRLVGAREEELFFQGYGSIAIDPLALAYYRYAWAVQDIGDYGEQALLTPDIGPQSKRHALDGFSSLFQPGNIVSLALSPGNQGV